MIRIILIFIATAIVITAIVQISANIMYKDYCTHTQIQKLQDSGDYYSCLGLK